MTKKKVRCNSLNKKPISDATEPFRVKITSRDVKKGSKTNPMSCALARGMTRSDKIVSVRIGAEVALIEYKKEVKRYNLKREDTKKIRAFDNSGYFQPGEYELVPPKKKLGVHTIGHKKKKRKSSSGPSGPSGVSVARRPPQRHVWRGVKKPAYA